MAEERLILGAERVCASRFEIDLFGPVCVRVQGQNLPPLPSRKGAYLLALLALRHGREVDRDYLAGLLWPDSDQEKALFNLRQTLSRLRQALGGEAWRLGTPTRHTLRLDVSGTDIDVVNFDLAVAQSHVAAWQTAVALYHGPLLEGCDEAWALSARHEREQALMATLEKLAEHAANKGNGAAAADYLRRIIALDVWREGAYRSLMRIYAAAGETAAATNLYRELRVLLHRELNTMPAPETVALYRQICQTAQAAALPPPTTKAGTISAIARVAAPRDGTSSPLTLETAGGAVPLGSPFYVPRAADGKLETAVAERHSVILVKGTRQTGKTSLLVRGLQTASATKANVVYTNVNALDAAVLESRELLYRTLMDELADQLELDVPSEQIWNPGRAANTNLDRFLRREVLADQERTLVWALDEVDRLFACEFRNEVFALFRSWHDRRAMDPDGAWARLTLVLAYTTEAHLFITDLNQSPFNVGTRLTVADFTLAQTADLNLRYGRPLKTDAHLERYYALVGGHPYLVRRGLEAMVADGLDINGVEAQAHREDGLYGSHLQQLYRSVVQDPTLTDLLRTVLRGNALPTEVGYYRLFSAGILAGSSDHLPRLRCRLYESYLSQRLL